MCEHACKNQILVQVEVFEHSLHILNATLSSKIGCSLVFRKAKRGHSLLSYSVQTCTLTSLTNETLEQLLLWQQIRLPKNTTKATRIRKLLETPHVVQRCTEASIQKLHAKLAEQEEKRQKKNNTGEEKKDEVGTFEICGDISISVT